MTRPQARLSLPILAIILTYVLTRIGYALLGVRFASQEVATFWHFLDIDLLRHQLLKSVLYLHAQPPLMNLFYGACLKAFPTTWPTVVYLLQCALGLLAWLAIYRVTTRNGVPPGFALALVLLALSSPAAALYEAEALYTHVVFCLLVFSAYFFDRYLDRRKVASAIALLACITVLVLWRSSYQALWFLAVAAPVVYLAPRRQIYRVAGAATVCFALIAGVYLKNGLLFGSFNSSSWLGMSLAKAWTWSPTAGIQKLVKQGKLSPVSGVWTFNGVDNYAGVVPIARPMGVEAVDAITHRNGSVNYNNASYVAISKAYEHDYWRVWRYSPQTLLAFSVQGWFDYLKPTTQYLFMDSLPNEQAVEPVDRIYRVLFSWRWMEFTPGSTRGEPAGQRLLHLLRSLSWTSVISTALLFAVLLSPRLRASASAGFRNRRLLLLFLIGNFFYSAFVGNLLEEGENMRFRFETHGLVLMAMAIVVAGFFSTYQARRVKVPVEMQVQRLAA